jgi:hypothetical protein
VLDGGSDANVENGMNVEKRDEDGASDGTVLKSTGVGAETVILH